MSAKDSLTKRTRKLELTLQLGTNLTSASLQESYLLMFDSRMDTPTWYLLLGLQKTTNTVICSKRVKESWPRHFMDWQAKQTNLLPPTNYHQNEVNKKIQVLMLERSLRISNQKVCSSIMHITLDRGVKISAILQAATIKSTMKE